MRTITLKLDDETQGKLEELLELYSSPYISNYWFRPRRMRALIMDLVEKKLDEELEKSRKEVKDGENRRNNT